MPTWVTPVIGLITLIFGAGSSWAILSYRQKRGESDQSNLMKDLKECVIKLQAVVTEVEIMKIANARLDRQGESHDKRLTQLEITVAKHIDRTRRKR